MSPIKEAIEALESVVAYDENDAQDGLELMLLYAKAMEQSRAALAALRSMPAEPVAWRYTVGKTVHLHNYPTEHYYNDGNGYVKGEPLYATPHTAPLSDAWISVDERLPDATIGIDGSAECVLVLFADGREPECASRWMVANAVWAQKAKQNGITHWQPLPPPPIERAVLRGGEQ